jgi:hypothetical protein
MSLVTRFPEGVVNRPITHPMGTLPFADPSKYQVFWDDFHTFTASGSGLYGWHKDEVNTGALDPTVQDAIGGVVKFTIDNADGDNANFQWALDTTVLEPFKVIAGKKAWLRVKFKTEDADKDIFQIGLHNAADDVLGTEPTDQFWFRTTRAAPDTLIFAAGKTDSTEVTASLGTISDGTWVVATAYYDGANKVYVTREDPDTGAVTATGTCTVTSSSAGDLLPDTEMTIGFGMEGIDTGADDGFVDFLMFVAER